MNEQCTNCLWAEQCLDYIANCEDYSPLNDDVDDLLDYALDLVDRSAAYQVLLDEYGGNA